METTAFTNRKRLQCISLDHRNSTVVTDVPEPSSQHMPRDCMYYVYLTLSLYQGMTVNVGQCREKGQSPDTSLTNYKPVHFAFLYSLSPAPKKHQYL